MKENAIKFLYAIDCYLLYMLSGVIAAACVVAYYSIMAAFNYDIIDSAVFVDYIAEFVSGKATVVLLVSYVVVFLALVLFFAVRRKSLAAYTGMTHSRFFSIVGAAFLGVFLNLITYILTPESASNQEQVNILLLICVIVGPFVEELMFRGILLKMFGSCCGIFWATVITSALFALAHAEPVQMLYSFVLGIVLCIIRVKSTSLWTALSAHLAFNITGAVAMLVSPAFSSNAPLVLACAALISFVIACTGGRKFEKGERK